MNNDFLAASPLDSARFNLNIVRGKTSHLDCKSLAETIFNTACDVAIIRIPSATNQLHQLTQWALPTLHADTLVYYRCDLKSYAPQPLRNSDISFRRAKKEDIPSLRALIEHTFKNYTSHYHANPLFPHQHILAGYQEWAENHIGASDALLWIAERESTIVAFAACSESKETSIGEGVLYGVAPTEAGTGIYGDLIRHTQADFKQRGFTEMLVSTQINNFAVQKVWAREGFHLFQAWDTYHVNAMLSKGEVVCQKTIQFSQAIEANLLQTIASKLIELDIKIKHFDIAFLRPVNTDDDYNLIIKKTIEMTQTESIHGILELLDKNKSLCAYAHLDIAVSS